MSATAVRSDWVGRVIDGRFSLLQWLGGSERGGVFLTELPGDSAQKAAIKLIPSDTEAEDRLAGWRAAARLSHPCLIHVFHTGRCEIDGTQLIFAVTEYADEVLSEILPGRPLAPEEVKELLGPVLDGLSYIHTQNFVHGRLRPSNILAVDDLVKLSADSLVASGSPSGYGSERTVYDAPERGSGEFLPASDIWSLGMTVAEALTQRTPEWNPPSDSTPVVPDWIPEPFAHMVRGCLEPDPARRFTIAEVRASLDPAAPQPEKPRETVAKITAAPVPEHGIHPEIETVAPGWSESRSSGKPRMRVLIPAAGVLLAAFALVWLRSHEPKPSGSEDAQQSAPAASTPEAQPKPPAGIAAAEKGETPHAASSSAPPPGNPAMGGPVVKGQVAERVMPEVLRAASRSIQGTVKVQVRVNVGSAGNVSNASFDAAGPSRYFARVAIEAAEQWKFRPAQVNGQPAPSTWILQFRFTRDGTDVTPTEATP